MAFTQYDSNKMDLQELSPNEMMMLTASKDEVDFVKPPPPMHNQYNNNNITHTNTNTNNTHAKITNSDQQVPKTNAATKVPKEHHHHQQQQQEQQQQNQHHHHHHHQRLSNLFGFSKKSKTHEEKVKPETYVTTTTTTNSGFPCQPTSAVPLATPPRQKKFVKSSSIARLLGNTYNAKKFEKEEKKLISDTKFNTFGGRRRAGAASLERFKRYAKEEGDNASTDNKEPPLMPPPTIAAIPVGLPPRKKDKSKGDTLDRHLLALEHFQESHSGDFGTKAMRTISRGLGKLWWRRTHSIDISSPDPEFKVSYLGNVLTGWAKGEGCVEKQLNTLWRNYTQNNKPDVIMRLKVCASGLKATTRQHGLTEYWANRITHCCAPKNYPRVFCWIYRHEGRKLKHELRCHAVLCSKEKQVQEICDTLKANLECALREFKREKILKQNARLSLANAVYDNPSLPRRKILLSVGSNNYRPPLERSKSAPKLMAIEEAIGEEGEEAEETNEPEMKPCCQKDSLYPAMTLGRRRCRRGHSIRRTGNARPVSFGQNQSMCASQNCQNHETKVMRNEAMVIKATDDLLSNKPDEEGRINYGSDDSDDFEKILKHNNYDSNISLANELMPYFESQLHKKTSSSCGSLSDLGKDDQSSEPLSLLSTINIDPNADPKNDFNLDRTTDSNNPASNRHTDEEEAAAAAAADISLVTLRRSGVCSDGEDDFLGEEEDDMYFRQAAILNMLHRHSMRKMANLSLSSDEGSSSLDTNSGSHMRYKHQPQSSISSDTSSVSSVAAHQQTEHHSKRVLGSDSADEGSISSGCETASTVTQNQDDLSLQFRPSHVAQMSLHLQANGDLDESLLESSSSLSAEEFYKHLHSRSSSGDATTTFSSSSSITLKMESSPCNSIKDLTATSSNSSSSNNAEALSKSASLSSNGMMSSASMNLSRPARRTRKQRDKERAATDSDSECSDESGYVEYQGREKTTSCSSSSSSSNSNKVKLEQTPKPQLPQKPQIPPKPMPRRFINNSTIV